MGLIKNFRGMRVAILHTPDRNRQIIADTLSKLGLSPTVIDPQGGSVDVESLLRSSDLLFFDADAPELSASFVSGCEFPIPTVAVLGLETPSRLERTLLLQPSALIHKPVRATGIYTAVFFAINQYRQNSALKAKLTDLETRHSSRRFVIKAVLKLIDQYGVDDDEAYRILRRESMQRRLMVEEFAIRFLAAGSRIHAVGKRRA